MALGKKTGGRKRGIPNKTTASIRELAKAHGESAIARLAQLMVSAESEQTQVAAAKELLDRGFGKSSQAVELTGKDGAPIQSVQMSQDEFREIAKGIVDEV
jgi:ribosomal protein S14